MNSVAQQNRELQLNSVDLCNQISQYGLEISERNEKEQFLQKKLSDLQMHVLSIEEQLDNEKDRSQNLLTEKNRLSEELETVSQTIEFLQSQLDEKTKQLLDIKISSEQEIEAIKSKLDYFQQDPSSPYQ